MAAPQRRFLAGQVTPNMEAAFNVQDVNKSFRSHPAISISMHGTTCVQVMDLSIIPWFDSIHSSRARLARGFSNRATS
jgi:hypothetical protein